MKKNLIILLIAIAISGFAQTQNRITNYLKKQNHAQSVAHAKVATIINLKDSMYQWSWNTSTSTWNEPNRNIYSYNAAYKENGDFQSTISSSTWTPTGQYISYVFDVNNNLLSKIYQYWSGTTWDNTTKYTYTYDASNNLLTSTYQNWTGTAWENSSKNTSTYDAYNNKLTDLYQNWDVTTSVWENNTNDAFTYDANHNLLTTLSQTYILSAWVNNYKNVSTYNASNEYTSFMSYIWNTSTNAWDNDMKAINFIYTGGDWISYELQQWNSSTSIYENSFRAINTFDGSHHILTSLYQNYDMSTSTWVNGQNDAYTYDVNGNQITNLSQIWDDMTSAWVNIYRQYDYYTSFVGLNHLSKQDDKINLYPNPATNVVSISATNKFTEISILDITGKILLSQNLKETLSAVVNIEVLQSGIYFIELKNGDAKTYKKLIKE